MPRRHAVNRPVLPRTMDQKVPMYACVQATDKWGDWRGWHVSLRTALQMVRAGEAYATTRKTAAGIITIYRELKPTALHDTSPTSLTVATMIAVADYRNVPYAEMPQRRKEHVGKYGLWPFDAYKHRNWTVRPVVSEREVRRAEEIMRHEHCAKRDLNNEAQRAA